MKHSIKDIDEDTLEDTSASKRAHLLHSNLPIIYNHVETNTSLSINHSHFQLNQHRSLYWLQYKDPKPCRKIAAFDLDNTLTIALEQGESERVQGKWKMFGGDLLIRDKLTELHDSGYKIVVFSNQYNLPARERHWQSFLLKLKLLLQTIDVPSQAFLATAKDDYRKPSSGMWEHFLNHCNKISSVDPTAHNVDMKNSFFIGDAAGRISGWKPGKSSDFSDSDR
ncbi:hypothetical protein HMI55_005115 [Coelomomyces lativittatus]|nr:hypothetical protein HMI55_005115 [Coelomomyces lativittatus]